MSELFDDPLFYNPKRLPPGQYGLDSQRGRYVYPHPITGEKWDAMRTSNLVSAFSDQRALTLYQLRQCLLGLREDESLFDALSAEPLETMDVTKAKKWLDALADRAQKTAGSQRAADRGTARHRMLQAWAEDGLKTGHGRMRAQLESLIKALDEHGFDIIPGMSEFRVCHLELEVIGTADLAVFCRRTGQIGVLDLKTQAKFWTYQEVSGQQYTYDAAKWHWEGPHDDTGRWVSAQEFNLVHPKSGVRMALLAHMPQGAGPEQLPVTLQWVDLEYGKRVAEQAYRNIKLRAEGMPVGPMARRPARGGILPVRG